MTTAPDYPGLVKLLSILRSLPDARKEAMLTTEEAGRIRSLGFAAEAGRWKVPPLPPELVRGSPLFENYSEGWDELQDGVLRTSQIQKPMGQPSARDREVVGPPAPPRPREIAVRVLRKREVSVQPNGNATRVNRRNPHARHEKRVPRSPWESIERRRPRKPTGADSFKDMPEPARSEARRIFARICEEWDSKRPNWREERWRKPLLVGRARWLATHPPDSSWGRSMTSKRKARRRNRKITNPGGAHRRRVRRQLGLRPTSARPIALLTKCLRDGKAGFMEFARLAVHIEPSLACVVETYESLKPWPRAAVSIDELCVKYGIDPVDYLSVVGEAALRYGNSCAIGLAAEHLDVASRFRT
jgi:hypothetical protein